MGFRTAAVIVSTCFMLGVLVTGLAKADWPILYGRTSTSEDLVRAERYYLTLFNAPGAVPALLHAMLGLCFLALSSKVATWKETNLFFDGSSTVLMIMAVALYASVSVPNLRILARQPLEEAQRTIGGRIRGWLNREMALPTDAAHIPEPLDDKLRYEVLSLLCASNNLMIAALVGVLMFQAAQGYAHRQFEKEMAKMQQEEKAKKSE